MEESLKNKYKKKIIEDLALRYGASSENLTLVGNHQSFVYRAKVNGRNIYIRITHESHRTEEQICAELNWILFLADNGIEVAKPILSINKSYIEAAANEFDRFFAVAFDEAIGYRNGEYPWSFEIPKRVGVMTAKMHKLAKQYEEKGYKRFEWHQNNFLIKAGDYLPHEHVRVIAELEKLMDKIKCLPKDKKSYGLIHGDLVACNYHLTDDKVSIFDFDESCYCWYINDIAIQTFYSSLTWQGYVDREGSKKCFMKFMEGYESITSIDKFWIEKMPLFIKLREIILYISIYRSRNMKELDQWSKNFMDGRRERIESNIPFIDIDFTKL